MNHNRFTSITRLSAFALILFLTIIAPVLTESLPEASAARAIIFPIIGPASYSNDFNAPRSNGAHHATDIFAPKGRLIVSPVDGVITFVAVPQPSWGYSLTIRDAENYEYRFIHINNDTPGTDDGSGGPMNAFAPDMKSGNPVVKGQHLAYVGDSGNAETTPPHLHFEMFAPDGVVINPFDSLNLAQRISSPYPYPQLPSELLPYSFFKGGLNIAMGNFDADQASEIVTGPGAGGGPHVKVLETNGTVMGSFFAYGDFTGGVDVAAADVDGDGLAEIITGAGPGGGPHVKVFKLDGTVVGSFFAYGADFRGGVKVSGGDLDGDGLAEIITGAGPGGGPHIKAFKLDGSVVSSFFAYGANFRGGADVAASDVTGTSAAEIITGAGPGGGPHVRVFSAAGIGISDFFPYNQYFNGGVRVSAANVRTASTKSEILTVPATPPGGPNMRMFTSTGILLDESNFMESWWAGYHDVGAGQGNSRAATGVNRRASVRFGLD